MAYQQAPKVQGTNMQPRQAAIQRRANKPKGPQWEPKSGPGKPIKYNTAHGLSQSNHLNNNGPKYNDQQQMANVNAMNQQTSDPNFLPMGGTLNPSTTPVATPTVPTGFTGYQPLGTGDPKLDKYLSGDDVFQGVLASLNRNRQMNDANLEYNRNNLNTDNETLIRRLTEQEGKDNKLLDDDYAARGLFGSGLFAKADVDLGQSYANQFGDLSTSLQRNLQQLLSDSESQNAMDEETLRQAQQDAITRRAQEFGIFGGPNNSTGKDKGKGKGKDKDKDKGKKGKK